MKPQKNKHSQKAGERDKQIIPVPLQSRAELGLPSDASTHDDFRKGKSYSTIGVHYYLKGFIEGKAQARKEILEEIDLEIKRLATISFKHCFEKGKMCEACFERRRFLFELKQKLQGERC